MKPVAIFRHHPNEGPGYFATCLEARNRPWTLIRVDAGDMPAASPDAYAGLAFMGGPMSVNDDLPWIPAVLALIRAAVAQGVPVIGHCLGGQLMAKALGGKVTLNSCKEIGWGRVDIADDPVAREWFGDTRSYLAFHWHGETFSLPAGARTLASSPYCAQQAFAVGPHLGMQCHVEMTAEIVRAWCESGRREIERSRSPAVQSVAEIQAQLAARIAALHGVAQRLYAHWIDGLRP